MFSLASVKRIVPDAAIIALSNCGGTALDPERFAGHLVRTDLSELDFLRIYNALIFPNGVRKTTGRARNTGPLRALSDRGIIGQPGTRLRVLEVGASAGLDALATRALLEERGAVVDRYDLRDLHTHILYDPQRGLVFDEDKNLVQVDFGTHFVGIHFSYARPYQRVLNAPKQLRPWLLSKRLRWEDSPHMVRIPLVHADVDLSERSPFRLQRANVFEPIEGEYDLVICMHLLVSRYFDDATIERGIQNLTRNLAPGGVLVVGAAEGFSVITREASAKDDRIVRRSSAELGIHETSADGVPKPAGDDSARPTSTPATRRTGAVRRDPYRAICDRVYLPAVEGRKGMHFAEASREALANQRRSPDELAQIEMEKLRALLAHAAASSPFYARRLHEAGVSPDSVRTRADLLRIPLLEKADIAKFADEMRCRDYAGKTATAVTSGSTGIPLRFTYSAADQGWIEACRDRGHRWWGVRRADRVAVLWGRPLVGGRTAQARAWLKFRLRNTLSFNTFEELDETYLAEIARSLTRFAPTLVYGYGSSIGALALHMERAGLRLREDQRPMLVEYTGDHMYETERKVAERMFGAPVVPLYGSSEAGSIACACPSGSLHVSKDHVLVEILRTDETHAAADEPGDIVVTTLNNWAMPLIRYRLGDYGTLLSEPCACGITLPRMNLLVGKTADRVTTSSRTLVSSYVVDHIAKHLTRNGIRGIRQFLVEQTGKDDFVLHVVKDDPFDPRSVEIFKEKMTEYFGESIQTKVSYEKDVPVSASGKRRWFTRSFDPIAEPDTKARVE